MIEKGGRQNNASCRPAKQIDTSELNTIRDMINNDFKRGAFRDEIDNDSRRGRSKLDTQLVV